LVIALAVILLQVAPALRASPKVAVPAPTFIQPAKTLPPAPVPAGSTAHSTAPENAGAHVLSTESDRPAAQNPRALDTLDVPQLPSTHQPKIIQVDYPPSRKAWLLLSIADRSAAAFEAYCPATRFREVQLSRIPSCDRLRVPTVGTLLFMSPPHGIQPLSVVKSRLRAARHCTHRSKPRM
jgi:hypothetical protein